MKAVNVDPWQRFEQEHHHALRELDRLEAAVRALEDGEEEERHLLTVREVHGFLTTAVREHNEREERTLFLLLGEEAPAKLFAEEHRALRDLEHRLGAALDGSDPAGRVPRPGREIVDLLRAHIHREDTVLFPMSREILGPRGLAAVERKTREWERRDVV